MNSNIDLLVIFPCKKDVLLSIDNIKDYASMQAYFINQYIYDNHKNIKTICIDNIWKEKYTKQRVSFSELKAAIEGQGIKLKNCKNILFTKLGVSKQFGQKTINQLTASTDANLFKLEDCNIRLINEFVTIGHFYNSNNDKNFFNAGLSVCTNTFTPKFLNDTIFRVHVDHNYQGVDNYFPIIKNLLHKLKDKIYHHTYWTDLEVTYHTQKESIDSLGHFNVTNVGICNLAKIYSKSNLSFLSHRESMGQYQLEMLSCGVNTVLPNKSAIPENIRNQLPLIYYKDIDFDKILDLEFLKHSKLMNRKLSLNYDYKKYVDKIKECVFDNS